METIQESEPVEEIHFIKDEMANMVWAIETKMNSLAGVNMEGDTAANYLRNAIELIEPPAGARQFSWDARRRLLGEEATKHRSDCLSWRLEDFRLGAIGAGHVL